MGWIKPYCWCKQSCTTYYLWNLWKTGYSPYQLVQDFFHQQYQLGMKWCWDWSWSMMSGRDWATSGVTWVGKKAVLNRWKIPIRFWGCTWDDTTGVIELPIGSKNDEKKWLFLSIAFSCPKKNSCNVWVCFMTTDPANKQTSYHLCHVISRLPPPPKSSVYKTPVGWRSTCNF